LQPIQETVIYMRQYSKFSVTHVTYLNT